MHSMEEFRRDCCIRGYHVYKETWRAAIGEESLGSTATDHLRFLASQCLVRTARVTRTRVIFRPYKFSRF